MSYDPTFRLPVIKELHMYSLQFLIFEANFVDLPLSKEELGKWLSAINAARNENMKRYPDNGGSARKEMDDFRRILIDWSVPLPQQIVVDLGQLKEQLRTEIRTEVVEDIRAKLV